MILALASTDWLMAEGWRQGLFVHCIEEDVVPPLPFNLQDPPGCYSSRDVFYIKATAALCILTLVADAVATLLTGSGLRTQDHNMKYKFYRIAVIIMSIAREYCDKLGPYWATVINGISSLASPPVPVISILIALILYPVCFANELTYGKEKPYIYGI